VDVELLFHTDGRTDRQTWRSIRRFRNFANAPKGSNGSYLKLRKEFRRNFVRRSVHDSLAWRLCAQRELGERESSGPGYEVVSFGKYLPTLVTNFDDYLPSQTASHFSNNAVRTPHLSSRRIIFCYNLANHRYAPRNDVSVNDGPHIRRWSHNIIILTIVLQIPIVFSIVTCCTGL